MHTNFSQATHQSTISQGVGITITDTHKPSSQIQRGEAKNQTQMQTTKTQSEDTNIKNLAKDAIDLAKVVGKIINATKKDKK